MAVENYRSGRVPVRRAKAFTLVELLVVIGIIAMLIGILLPSLSKAQMAARTAQCESNLHQISLAAMMYTTQNHDTLPPNYGAGEANASVPPSFDNVHWVGQTGSVWWLLEQYGLDPNSPLAMCPEVRNLLGDYGLGTQPMPSLNGTVYPNARFSYLYNKIISGMQGPGTGYFGYQPQGHQPTYQPSTSTVAADPFKLGQIANASGVAMFIDGLQIVDRPEYDWPNNINNGFNLHFQFDLTSSGHQYLESDNSCMTAIHSRHPGAGVMTNGLGRIEGTTNIAYCDGSVRNQIINAAPLNAPGGAASGTAWIMGTACDPAYAP